MVWKNITIIMLLLPSSLPPSLYCSCCHIHPSTHPNIPLHHFLWWPSIYIYFSPLTNPSLSPKATTRSISCNKTLLLQHLFKASMLPFYYQWLPSILFSFHHCYSLLPFVSSVFLLLPSPTIFITNPNSRRIVRKSLNLVHINLCSLTGLVIVALKSIVFCISLTSWARLLFHFFWNEVVDDVVNCCWFSFSGGSFSLGEPGLFDVTGSNDAFFDWCKDDNEHDKLDTQFITVDVATTEWHILEMTKTYYPECHIVALPLSITAGSLHNLQHSKEWVS